MHKTHFNHAAIYEMSNNKEGIGGKCEYTSSKLNDVYGKVHV